MKKKLLAWICVLTLTLALLPVPAQAAGASAFPDVTDTVTAQNIEILRLLGVLNGGSDGKFHPNESLTRAQFCKMAIELQGRGAETALFKTRTIFPDVRANHWAIGYINLAAAGEGSFIRGLPNGTFAPDKAITDGEAVTILMRILGYGDAEAGAVWPDGYVNLARTTGVGKDLTLTGHATITRANAAQLFVNTLRAKLKGSEASFITKRGEIGEETTLVSVDAAKGEMRTADLTYPMALPMTSTALNGARGCVVTNAGKAITFLPTVSESGGAAVSDAAIIVSADGSDAGIDAITGGAENYTILRNGVRATVSDLKRWDVATYSVANNTLTVCDTRVSVVYETCEPSVTAPERIFALGGTAFTVMRTAQQSVTQFRPGDEMVLLLTADGVVAGAVAPGTAGAEGNALAFVDGAGSAHLICGGAPLKSTLALENVKNKADILIGQVARVSQSQKGSVQMDECFGGVNGDLDVSARKLGDKRIASDALIFDYGAQIRLSSLKEATVAKREINYARTNAAGQIDLLVLRINVTEETFYGRAWVGYGTIDPEEEFEVQVMNVTYAVKGEETKSPNGRLSVTARSGDYVEAILRGERFVSVTVLDKAANVPSSAWIGEKTVNVNGLTCTVPADVPCYNRDSGKWMSSLAAARTYADGTMTVYYKDNVVRIIEVGG